MVLASKGKGMSFSLKKDTVQCLFYQKSQHLKYMKERGQSYGKSRKCKCV